MLNVIFGYIVLEKLLRDNIFINKCKKVFDLFIYSSY